jgi:hypothetical protein
VVKSSVHLEYCPVPKLTFLKHIHICSLCTEKSKALTHDLFRIRSTIIYNNKKGPVMYGTWGSFTENISGVLGLASAASPGPPDQNVNSCTAHQRQHDKKIIHFDFQSANGTTVLIWWQRNSIWQKLGYSVPRRITKNKNVCSLYGLAAAGSNYPWVLGLTPAVTLARTGGQSGGSELAHAMRADRKGTSLEHMCRWPGSDQNRNRGCGYANPK